MNESKECYFCHRIGYRGFVPYRDRAWCCTRADLCHDRRVKQSRDAARRLGPMSDAPATVTR